MADSFFNFGHCWWLCVDSFQSCVWKRNAVLQPPYAASETMQLTKVSGKKKCSYHPSSSTCAGRCCDKLKASEKKINGPETQVFTCRSGYPHLPYQHTPPFHSLFQHQCFPHQWRQNDKWLSSQVGQVNNDILIKLFEVPVWGNGKKFKGFLASAPTAIIHTEIQKGATEICKRQNSYDIISDVNIFLTLGNTKETGSRNATAISENYY
jgi:hypothetical protein